MVLPSSPSSAEPVKPGCVSSAPGFSFCTVGEIGDGIVAGLRMADRLKRSPLHKGWIEFIGRYEWQWFATMTFKDPVHPEAAHKSFRHWIRQLDHANGYRYTKKASLARRCVWLRGLEWQKRDVIHFHALIGNLPFDFNTRSNRDLYQELWNEMGCGISRCLAVEEKEGAAAYVAKYCSKDGEIDISPNFWAPGIVSGTTSAA